MLEASSGTWPYQETWVGGGRVLVGGRVEIRGDEGEGVGILRCGDEVGQELVGFGESGEA